MKRIDENEHNYYWANGKKVELVRDPSAYVVKFKMGARSDSSALSSKARRFLREESEDAGFLAKYGMQVYQAKPRAASAATAVVLAERTEAAEVALAVEDLNSEERVEFAAPAFRQTPASRELIFPTNQFLVQFKPEVSEQQIHEFNSRHNVKIVDRLGYVENGYLLEAPSGAGESSALKFANLYYESGLAVFSHPDFIRRLQKKVTTTSRVAGASSYTGTREEEAAAATLKPSPGAAAPREETTARAGDYLAQQWHLNTAKVTDAWQLTRGSAGICIAVADDGIDVPHPEFSGKVSKQYDFELNTADGTPKLADDSHGTACAGVATAVGVKAFGAAPNCSLMAVRTPHALSDSDFATMFQWMASNGADVISCSWGPPDNDGAFVLPDNIRAAIRHCVTNGRGGKGIPIFFAAGNGNELVSDDGYAANPDVMAIAASTDRETKAYYSDYGPEIWVCAPSSGSRNLGEKGVFTTDRHGASGYNAGTASAGDAAGDYTNSFGGTSSATPLVAGIAGLMLSANPNLTEQQIRKILKDTAEKIGGQGIYNAAGHNQQFGYGRVDAQRAVQAAKNLAGGTSPLPGGAGPSMQGPQTMRRTDGPPTFQFQTGSNPYFAVEVATRADLFDNAGHSAERNQTNFFASWQVAPYFRTGSSYTLPADAWDRLKNADRLFYRLWTTASNTGWVSQRTTTPDAQAATAPAIMITSSPASGSPWITGPASHSRTAGAPAFQFDVRPNSHFALEVATRADLFDNANHGAERNQSNFFASWQLAPYFRTGSSYTLPADAWDRLKSATQLFYRLWTTASSTGWASQRTTTPDAQAATAPSISITGGGRTSERDAADKTVTYPSGAVFKVGASPGRRAASDSAMSDDTPPSILGPETYDRRSPDGPTFTVAPGDNQYFAIEVATHPDLFDRSSYGDDRTSKNFFASWKQQLRPPGGEADGITAYTLPVQAWEELREARRLYYRVVTASSQDNRGWPDYQTSTPDERAADAPLIRLTDRVASLIDSPRDESRWRAD